MRLHETGHQIKVLSLENYRTNPKAELSRNELILFKVVLNMELNKAAKQTPFTESKEFSIVTDDPTFKMMGGEKNELVLQLIKGTSRRTDLSEDELKLKNLIKEAKRNHRRRIERDLRKDPSTRLYRLKNAAMLRFGWAMTVHRSMSYKWKEVIFNVDPGESVGRANDNYYRWLYTGISRATQKVDLINYRPIGPFDKTEFKNHKADIRPQGVFFHSEDPNPNVRLDELKEYVSLKIRGSECKINNVAHHNWREQFHFLSAHNQEAIISFVYNKQGYFKLPSITDGDTKVSAEIVKILSVKTPLNSFDAIKDHSAES